jgi:glycerol-3-phosphate acyltransferase PlsX
MIRIALDVMGGDHAPEELVRGGVVGARAHEVQVLLVGDPPVIEPLLERWEPQHTRVEVVPATQAIAMNEDPVRAVRRSPDASVMVANRLVREGLADAAVTVGHTGAGLVAALFTLGRLPGIDRPAIGVPYLAIQPETLLIDAGVNVDVRPRHLVEFAAMGSAYMQAMHGIARPTVGLLTNGTEDNKGGRVTREAFGRLRESGLNFIGNVEGLDLPRGTANVIVADGLVGNIALKISEGLTEVLLGRIAAELRDLLPSDVAEREVMPVLRRLTRENSYENIGAMPLLGTKGITLIGHGRSKSRAVVSAIGQAKQAVQAHLVQAMEAMLASVVGVEE